MTDTARTRPMPPDADLAPPEYPGAYTVEECDEVLARRPRPAVADAWLDERISAAAHARDQQAG